MHMNHVETRNAHPCTLKPQTHTQYSQDELSRLGKQQQAWQAACIA
jgi:hypothetical protein